MAKLTYEDLFELVREIERGAKDKSRSINGITNTAVKEIVQNESKIAIKTGVTATLLTTGTTVSGALIGSAGGAGTGIVATGLSSLGVASFTGASGAVAGSAAGSVVPIVGTIIGAVVGVGVGVFVGNRHSKKNAAKKMRLMQEVASKQNTSIRDLEKEVDELKEKYEEAVELNERYRYVIGLLMANEELKNVKN